MSTVLEVVSIDLDIEVFPYAIVDVFLTFVLYVLLCTTILQILCNLPVSLKNFLRMDRLVTVGTVFQVAV